MEALIDGRTEQRKRHCQYIYSEHHSWSDWFDRDTSLKWKVSRIPKDDLNSDQEYDYYDAMTLQENTIKVYKTLLSVVDQPSDVLVPKAFTEIVNKLIQDALTAYKTGGSNSEATVETDQ
jgi:hypothetical protein